MSADAVWRGAEKKLVKDLFGRPLRAALASWILSRQGEPFYLREAQDAVASVGESPSGVLQELRTFMGHGMLTMFPDGRRTYYTLTDGPLWTAFDAIATACRLHPEGRSTGGRRRLPSGR